MNKFDYNQPDTRARVAARRKARTNRPTQAARPGPKRAASSWITSGRLVSLLLLIASLGAFAYVGTSPRFAVRQVDVQGAQALDQQTVANLAGARGLSIWLVDTKQIIERLKTNAYVESASASITLPDQLTIHVSERRPDVRWLSGGALYLLDADGRVLDTGDTTPVSNTLVIEDGSNQLLKPNDHVDADALKLGRVLSLRLPSEAGMTPTRIGWNTDTKIFVNTADNRTIIFGTSDNLDSKLQVLETLLKQNTPFTLLDLRPSTPYYRDDGNGNAAPADATEQPNGEAGG